MGYLISITIIIATVLFMEIFAWLSHKYILHGPLWTIHKSHHSKSTTWWESNDIFALVYALASSLLIYRGIENQNWTLWVGLGILVYGILYFLLHDIIIHRRIKFKIKVKNSYLARLVRAHKIHHKVQTKMGSEAFGFLYASKKFDINKQ